MVLPNRTCKDNSDLRIDNDPTRWITVETKDNTSGNTSHRMATDADGTTYYKKNNWVVEFKGGAMSVVDLPAYVQPQNQKSLNGLNINLSMRSIDIQERRRPSLATREEPDQLEQLLMARNRRYSNHHDLLQGDYKPIQDVNLGVIGEKCFILMDKNTTTVVSDNAKEKQYEGNQALFFLIDVTNSKRDGAKNITLNSRVQIKSELNFNVNLILECEGKENYHMELGPNEVKYVPVSYCIHDTSMFISGEDRHQHQLEDLASDNELRFNSFFSEGTQSSYQFTNVSNYYNNEESADWDKITEKDNLLTLFVMKKQADGSGFSKVMVTTTIYRRKIYISNRGNQKEFAYAYMVTFRHMMVIKNATPRPFSLSLAHEGSPIFTTLETNEKFEYMGNNPLGAKTSIKVGRV